MRFNKIEECQFGDNKTEDDANETSGKRGRHLDR